jgi:hypothetical protein
MRKRTIYAAFENPALFLHHLGCAGTVLQMIHGAIAKQTINVIASLVTGIVLTISVLEIPA